MKGGNSGLMPVARSTAIGHFAGWAQRCDHRGPPSPARSQRVRGGYATAAVRINQHARSGGSRRSRIVWRVVTLWSETMPRAACHIPGQPRANVIRSFAKEPLASPTAAPITAFQLEQQPLEIARHLVSISG